jgi:DNA modification methylase
MYNLEDRMAKRKTPSKLIEIDYQKTCNCPENHINCLTAKEWIQSQVAIWEFSYERRDILDKSIHPAVFPIGLPAKCIKLFTHEGELVIDPFCGIGTTLLAAQDLNRNAIGFDLKQEYIDITYDRLSRGNLINKSQQIAIKEDARNIPQYLRENTISLIVTSPPYSRFLDKPRLNKSMRGDLRNNKHYLKVQQYSQDDRDIGTLDTKEFVKELGKIFENLLPFLRTRAHCVIDINDLWWENRRYPTHALVIEELNKRGYDLRNVIIWDRRPLVNRVGIFGWPNNFIKLGTTFEYILDFWKPG